MKTLKVFAAVMIMLLMAQRTRAGVSSIMNGSFEDDGYIADITVKQPNGWSDVNVPAGKFTGYVSNDWVTDGSYNLTLYSFWYTGFEANDIAMVSQEVNLTDVNEIIFDLKLQTYPSDSWDPDKRTAVVMIDGVEVWNSDDYQFPSNGEYRNQVIPVDFPDREPHRLSLGIRADVNETPAVANTFYYTFWDFVEFNCHCGGNGFLLLDFNRDCYIDMGDLKILANVWLHDVVSEDDPNNRYNLYRNDEIQPYGSINFFDYAVFSNTSDVNIPELKMFVEGWLEEVDIDNGYNLFHGDDVHPRLIINFLDFAVFADRWLKSSYDLD
jgi:hypothetical protein